MPAIVVTGMRDYGGGQHAARRLRQGNLLACGIGLPAEPVDGDVNGLRIGTPELARLGMTEADMPGLAGFIARGLEPDTSPAEVAPEVLGKKAGVELPVLWDAIKIGAGDSFVARHDVPSIFAGHYDPSFTLDMCCKDLGLIAALSQATQIPAPMTVQAQDRFEAARAAFGGDQAELLVCKLIEDASGVDLRVPGDWPRHWEG